MLPTYHTQLHTTPFDVYSRPYQLSVESVYGSSSSSDSDSEPSEGLASSSTASQDHHEEECSHSSAQQQPQKKRKITKRGEDDNIPLPNPFPLPKHYGPNVEKALETKQFTKSDGIAFIGKIASAMLYYKQLPTAADYINVSQTILRKYPFLKLSAGVTEVYVAI